VAQVTPTCTVVKNKCGYDWAQIDYKNAPSGKAYIATKYLANCP
jgi:hypothetical protein